MQSREAVQVRVGLFVFAGVFVAMIVIFLLGGEKQLFQRQYVLHTYFEDISGLRIGAPVQLAGVRVGMVDQIAFGRTPDDKKVRVRLSVNRRFQERIRADSTATIVTQGLLGDKTVSISVGSPEKEVLQDGDLLPAEERISLFALSERVGSMVVNIDKAAKAVEKVLHEVETGEGLLHTLLYETKERPVGRDFSAMAGELRIAAKELKQILQKVNRGEGTLGALVTDASLYSDLRRLFGKIERNRLLRHIIRSRIRDLETEKEGTSEPAR